METTTSWAANSGQRSYLEARMLVVASAGMAERRTLTPVTRFGRFASLQAASRSPGISTRRNKE